MSWFKKDEDIHIIVDGDTEEKALETLNTRTDKDLVHNGRQTDIWDVSDGSVLVIGHFRRRD